MTRAVSTLGAVTGFIVPVTAATLTTFYLIRPRPLRLIAKDRWATVVDHTTTGRGSAVLMSATGTTRLARSHFSQPFQPSPRFLNGSRFNICESRITIWICERPFFIDELVSKLTSPRGNRLSCSVIGHHATRTNEQQWIGLYSTGSSLRRCRCREMFTSRAQGASQWISRARRSLEVGRRKSDSFWLKKHSVNAALNIKRPPMGAIGTDKRNNSIGRWFFLSVFFLFFKGFQRFAGFSLETIYFLFLNFIKRSRTDEQLSKSLTLLKFVREFSCMILNSCKLHSCFFEIACSLFTDTL